MSITGTITRTSNRGGLGRVVSVTPQRLAELGWSEITGRTYSMPGRVASAVDIEATQENRASLLKRGIPVPAFRKSERQPTSYIEIEACVMRPGENANGVMFPAQILKAAADMGRDRFMYFGHLSDDEFKAHKGMIVMDKVCGFWAGAPTWGEDAEGPGFFQKGIVWKPEAVDMLLALRESGNLHVLGPSTDLMTDGPTREENGRVKKHVETIDSWCTTDLVGYPAARGSISRVSNSKVNGVVSSARPLDRVLNSVVALGDHHSRLVRAVFPTGARAMAITNQTAAAPSKAQLALEQARAARERDFGIIDQIASDLGLATRDVSAVKAKRRTMAEAPSEESLRALCLQVRDKRASAPSVDQIRTVSAAGTGANATVTADFKEQYTRQMEAMFDRTLQKLESHRNVSAFRGMREATEVFLQNDGRFSGRVESAILLDVLRATSIVGTPFNALGNRVRYPGMSDVTRTSNAREAARSLLESQRASFKSDSRVVSALMDSDITTITQSVMNKAMLKFYKLESEGGDPSYAGPDRLISRTISTNRFGDTHRFIRLQELDVASTVAQGQPYPVLVNPTSLEETAFVTRKGYIIQITEQTLANDDLGLVRMLPESIGRGLGRTFHRDLYNILLNNTALTSDGVALGAAGHSNNITGAVSYANLKQMMRLMLRKKAYGQGSAANRAFLATRLRQILCSATIYPDILEMVTLDTTPDTGNRGASALVNPKTPPLVVLPVPYWDETETGLYWGTDDPVSGAVELIIALYYQGRTEPELFSQEAPEVGSMFTNDLWTLKGRFTYGFGIAGAEGFVRGHP